VVKHADAAELRVVVAEVLAAADDTVLVARHLRNKVPSGCRSGPPARAQFRAGKKPGGGEHAGKRERGAGGG
jgi:hypothetical protein